MGEPIRTLRTRRIGGKRWRGREWRHGDGLLVHYTIDEEERLVFLRTEYGYDERKTAEFLMDLAAGQDPHIPPNGHPIELTAGHRDHYLGADE